MDRGIAEESFIYFLASYFRYLVSDIEAPLSPQLAIQLSGRLW